MTPSLNNEVRLNAVAFYILGALLKRLNVINLVQSNSRIHSAFAFVLTSSTSASSNAMTSPATAMISLPLVLSMTSLLVVMSSPFAVTSAVNSTHSTVTVRDSGGGGGRSMTEASSTEEGHGLKPQVVIVVGVLVALPALVVIICVLRAVCRVYSKSDSTGGSS